MSKRERLIWTARRLRLQFPASISDNALENLINRQPATDAQLQRLEILLKPLNRPVPYGITYGKAREALALAAEGLNHYAIEVMGLREGDVREWEGKYRYIVKIFNNLSFHRIQIQTVRLTRQPGSTQAAIHPIGAPSVIDPHEMLYLSSPVDLKSWRPPSAQPKVNHSDEPDF